jgi:cytochrome c5
VAVLALLVPCAACTKPWVSKVKPFVRGYLAVRVGASAGHEPGRLGGRDVFLPRVKVHLLNLADNSRSDPVTTDLSGRFTLPASVGSYRVCWEADGFETGCTTDVVSVAGAPVHLSTVRINIAKAGGMTAVFGSVRLSDGSSFRLLEPLADVNVFGRVLLLDETRSQRYEALVNNFGDYVLPQVPVKAHVFLEARAEAGQGIQEVMPHANLAGAAFHRIDLAIRNTPPRLEALVARHASGERVQVASAGETLTVKASAADPDGDPVKFQWLADTGVGSLSSSSGPQVDWTLPSTEALYSLTLIASDGKGGHVRQSLPVRVDAQGVVFSGRVVSTAGGPIAGANVSVNGKTAATDATGFFRLHVPAAKRYVLNVDKLGFSQLSRIVDHGVIGGIYQLRPATVVTADPTGDIDVQDKRSPRDCPGPASLKFDSKLFPGGVRPVFQDGKGNVTAPRKDAVLSLERYRQREGCGPGVRVRIPANSLVDGGGNRPSGPVQVSLSTVDLMSPDQMPGDYTVSLPVGGTRVMESYGAASVEITSGGTPFNLNAGATAEVVIPVDPAQLTAGAALPATIPILFYDRVQGTWKQETTAALQGSVYVAKVTHFSSINTDLVKTNQACVRVDASHPGLPGSFRMQVIIPLGTSVAPRVLDVAIDNSLQKEHVVYNLPTNTNITLAPYDAATTVPFGTFIVNTGGAQNPTNPNLPFGPPYVACSTLVVFTPQVAPDDPISGEFLHGLFSFAATKLVETDIPVPGTLSNQLDQATANYYSRVDPTNTRQTLGGFKTVYGFGGGGAACAGLAAGETCAIYANSGDLGFGREMHCKKNGANVACYVTNFGNIATDDADDVVAAVAGSGKVATVAMEHAPIEGDPVADPVVKFFVYNAADNRVNAADLDGKGLRPVPQLCMVCHGGSYPGGGTTGVPPFNTVDEAKLGSEFIAFDLHNYAFAASPFDKASQQAAFKTLNEQIVLGTNPGPPTQLHIAEMYDGDNGVPPTTQEELLVVSDPSAAAADRWTAQPPGQEMYKHVVGNACRTCHATNPAPSLQFVNAKQVIDILGSVEFRVCSQHVMPHAKRTHDLFWLSADRPDTAIVDPHQPGILEAFGSVFGNATNGWAGNLCGVFTAGGATPPSAFTDIQSQVFTPQCSGCHLGSTPAGNLNLGAGNAYAQLVGVDSCVRPAMKRVQAGSANDSFLFRKIQGNHTGLSGCNVAPCNPFSGCSGGCGSQMPYSSSCVSSSPVSAAQQTLIQSWISAGAPN